MSFLFLLLFFLAFRGSAFALPGRTVRLEMQVTQSDVNNMWEVTHRTGLAMILVAPGREKKWEDWPLILRQINGG